MNKLKTLVIMQLKDKLDFNKKLGFKKVLFKIIFALLKFVIITAVIYFGFTLLSMLRLVDLTTGIPDKFLAVLFTIMTILSILTCTIGLVKSLYYAKDNALLLTMPTNRINIFFSKLIVYYVYELIRNVTYLLPLFIAFGLVNKYAFYYFIWAFISLIWITAISVMVGALLSIPAMYISNFFRNFKGLQYFVIATLIGVAIFVVVTIINKIPENFNIVESWGTTFWEIQDFLDSFESQFIPFYWLMESVVGTRYGASHSMFYLEQWLCLLGTIGLVAILIGLCFLIVRPLFFHIASSPFEYKKELVKHKKKNLKKNSFMSAVHKEVLLDLRTPDKLYTLIGIAVGMPIAILLLNKIFNAMDTRLTGTYMTVTFNILMILLLALSSNTVMAKVYSEEGNSAYLIKTNPKPYFNSLFAKLVPNIFVMTLSILATTIIFGEFANGFVNIPMLFITIESIYLGHLLWSAELDIMNPQIAQYATTGTHTNNPNEIKSTIYMFILSVLMAFITFFLIGEGVTLFWVKAMIIGLLFMAMRIYFYVMKIKVYYKEK